MSLATFIPKYLFTGTLRKVEWNPIGCQKNSTKVQPTEKETGGADVVVRMRSKKISKGNKDENGKYHLSYLRGVFPSIFYEN